MELRDANLQGRVTALDLGQDRSLQVEFATSQTAAAAKKGLLRERADLAVMLDPSSASEGGSHEHAHMLFLIASSPTTGVSPRQYSAYIIGFEASNSAMSKSPSLRLLENWSLPDGDDDKSYAFDVAKSTGLVHRWAPGELRVFRLSIQVRTITRLELPKEENLQVQPMNRSTVLVVNQCKCYLYDTKFGAVHAAQRLGDTDQSPSNKKKRKRENAHQDMIKPRLLSWYAKTNTVVAQLGEDLIAFRLSFPHRRRKASEPRLVDAFGRHRSQAKAQEPSQSSEITGKYEVLLNSTKGKAFEETFFDLLSAVPMDHPHKSQHSHSVTLKALAVMFKWNHSRPNKISRGDRHSSITLMLMSAKVFRWLCSNNQISAANIGKALYQNQPPADGLLPRVTDTDVIIAIAKQDASLCHLVTFANAPRLSLESCVESLRLFLRSFDSAPGVSMDQSAADGMVEAGTDKDVEMDGTAGTSDLNEAAETASANVDLSLAFSRLDDSPARGQAIYTIITRLGLCFAPFPIITAFRSQLHHHDMITLIGLLRNELSYSGWTSKRLDFYPGGNSSIDPADEAIHMISKLLNYCVDALGVGGWLTSSLDAAPTNGHATNGVNATDGDNVHQQSIRTNSEAISHLRQATDASLEAAQESAFFSNFLTDFMRYSTNLAAAEAQDQHSRKGRPPTSMSADGHAGPENNMLPLGAKSAEAISRFTINAGGEIKERSQRDIAGKESRKVARYEFERLRL